MAKSKAGKINWSPPSILAMGFLSIIVLGTLLFKLPIMHVGHLSWMQAFFTATSAVTITGLSVIDVGLQLTLSGQILLLVLVQLGGLGFMTFAILAVLSLNQKMGVRQQLFAQSALGTGHLVQVGNIAKYVFLYSIMIELVGIIILFVSWLPHHDTLVALKYAVFYSISAFNNAGFSLFPDSLMSFNQFYFISLFISALYILGGIGFLVLMDVVQQRKWSKLTPNTKLILLATLIINLVAFILVWLLEASNHKTIGLMPLSEQGLHAWLQATTPRSSGFNSLNIADMTAASNLLMMLLMFIGGGSLSTAGGIKIGTFVVLILSTISFLRRSPELKLFGFAISDDTRYKALAVAVITTFIIFVGCFLLLIFEPHHHIEDIWFEVVSAACTVGLSRGITADLHPVSQFLLCMLMFAGRLGPLTLAYLISTPRQSRIRHAETDIQIG